MTTIQLTTSEWTWYYGGKVANSSALGNGWDESTDSLITRVGMFQFTAPSVGASEINLILHTGGKPYGSHVQLRFYIGTSPTSHKNAGPDYEYTGILNMDEPELKFSGSANVVLLPNQTYYLWVFPGENKYGWYRGYRLNYTSLLTLSGAAMSDVDGKDGVLGEPHQLTLTRHSEYQTNDIEATCGNASIEIAKGIQENTVSWTPPIAWSAQNTKGTSVAVKITCITYSEKTEIGRTYTTINFEIPPSVVPSVSLSVTDKNGHFDKYGSYIQKKSQAEVSAFGSGVYGSVITEYSVSSGNVTQNGGKAVFDLPDVGSVRFVVKATDSRGRTATAETTISVIEYSPPTVTILATYRSDADGNQDDDGTYATVVFKANITPLYNKNSADYSVKYCVRGSNNWNTVYADGQTGNYNPEGAVQVVPIELDSAYEIAVSAKDDFAEIESLHRTVQVAFFLISTHKSTKAVGIGQKATEEGLCAFGIPAKFNAGVNVDGKNLVFAYSESIGGYVLVETEG